MAIGTISVLVVAIFGWVFFSEERREHNITRLLLKESRKASDYWWTAYSELLRAMPPHLPEKQILTSDKGE